MSIGRPLRATIDLDALRHNYALAKSLAAEAKAWAVIKADAYGHGQWRAVQALRESADGFAVLEAENAAALREAGISHPILLLEGVFNARDARLAVEFGLTCVVHCRDQLDVLRVQAAGRPLPPLYFKFNTGMNRLGLNASDRDWLFAALAELPPGTATLMTHFADADGERGISRQLECFASLTAGWNGPVSLANSAAIIRYPTSHGAWVRPGIMLYGASPFAGQTAADLGLRPAMALESRIIAVQHLAAGDRVGYGGAFEATEPMRIGIVACGYADGYPRHAGTGTPIAVQGRATRTLGRVSMDMLACELTAIPEADVGAPVTLWGEGVAGTVPADDVAAAAGTIAYELFCALAPRVPVAVKEGA